MPTVRHFTPACSSEPTSNALQRGQSTARDICSTTPRTATSHRPQVPPYVSNCRYRSAIQHKKSRHSKELEKVVREATGVTLDDIDEATLVVSDTTARQF
jgi:hypothetical protein